MTHIEVALPSFLACSTALTLRTLTLQTLSEIAWHDRHDMALEGGGRGRPAIDSIRLFVPSLTAKPPSDTPINARASTHWPSALYRKTQPWAFHGTVGRWLSAMSGSFLTLGSTTALVE